MTAPANSCSAVISECRISKSRWLVGSSSSSRLGRSATRIAERQPRAFAAGEVHHRLEYPIAAEPEAAQMIAAPLLVPLRARADFVDAVRERDQRGVARIEPVDFELREVADDEIRARRRVRRRRSVATRPR